MRDSPTARRRRTGRTHLSLEWDLAEWRQPALALSGTRSHKGLPLPGAPSRPPAPSPLPQPANPAHMNRVGVSDSQATRSNMAGRRSIAQRFHRGRMDGSERSEVNLIVKYFLFFFNFVLWLAGMAVVGLMSWLLYEKQKTVKSAIDFFFDPTCLFCLGGCIAVAICIVGWVGSLREITVCLSIYSWILILFLILEVIVIIFLFVFYYVPDVLTQLKIYPEDLFKDAIVKYRDDEDLQNLVDSMQRDLACCGVSNDNRGYLAWNENPYFNCTDGNKSPEKCGVPFSCCQIKSGDAINYQCGGGVLRNTDPSLVKGVNTNGCLKGLQIYIESNALVIGGIIIGILLPQGILACCGNNLKHQINAQKAKWRY